MKLYYSSSYVGAGHDFDTTRKAKWVADSLNSTPIKGVDIVPPSHLSTEDLLRVHDDEYVHAVFNGKPLELAESQGFEWDGALWPTVMASNGGVLAAARAALADGVSGSLSSGLHHAKRDRGDGFCTFNGLVIAAKALLASREVGSVLILDFDAHCGGGTASLITDEDRIWHVDVSVSPFDSYPEYFNSILLHVEEAPNYLVKALRGLDNADRVGPYDLVLYNAGMDPYQDCDIGGLHGITAEILSIRERMVFEWCSERNVPVAFVLAGGYIGRTLSEETLVNLHRLTIEAAARVEGKVLA